MSEKHLIVGLGNYEQKYLGHRHNVGFMVLDEICRENSADLRYKEKYKGEFGETMLFGKPVVLLKPHTFMNLSGKSVLPLLKFMNISPEHLIVIHDELDCHFGKIKTKKGGGNAGHNGLKSITADIGTPDFHRIRIGIGRPLLKENVVQHVLSNFMPDEKKALHSEILPDVFQIIDDIINAQ